MINRFFLLHLIGDHSFDLKNCGHLFGYTYMLVSPETKFAHIQSLQQIFMYITVCLNYPVHEKKLSENIWFEISKYSKQPAVKIDSVIILLQEKTSKPFILLIELYLHFSLQQSYTFKD